MSNDGSLWRKERPVLKADTGLLSGHPLRLCRSWGNRLDAFVHASLGSLSASRFSLIVGSCGSLWRAHLSFFTAREKWWCERSATG